MTNMDVIEYSITDAAISEYKEKYQNLTADTPKEYKELTAAIAVLRTKRVEVEKMRKAYKKDAIEYGRRVDAEAKRVIALLLEVEEPLKAKKKAVDDEKARIAEEKRLAEEKRVESIKNNIAYFDDMAVNAYDMQLNKVKVILSSIEDREITEDVYQEFMEDAKKAKDVTVRKIKARIEELQEKAEQEAKIREIEEANRKAQAELEAVRKEKEETERKAREEIEKAEAKKAEAERKIKEQKEAEEKSRREAELKARLEREAKEIAEREEEEKRKAEEAARIIEEKRKAKEEARKPDIEKAVSWLSASIKNVPEVNDRRIGYILTDSVKKLEEAREYLQEMHQ